MATTSPPPGLRTLLRDSARGPGGIVTYLLGLNAVAFVTWVITHGGSPESRALISDLVFIPTGLASTLLAWRASRHPAISEATRRAWMLLAAALAATWMGDVLFAYYELVPKSAPFPPVADAGTSSSILWSSLV